MSAGQNEFSLHVRLTGLWQSPITAASSSHNLWPSSISLGWDGGQKKLAGGCASVRESACRWNYDACRPFVQQAVPAARQLLSSTRSEERGGTFFFFTSISPPHCNIGRFLLQLPVRAFIQTTETVQFKDNLAAAEEVCFWLQGGKLHRPSTCRIYCMTSLLANQGLVQNINSPQVTSRLLRGVCWTVEMDNI